MDANTILLARILVNGAVTIALVWALVWYELQRKWNRDELRASGLAALWAPIVRYRVALIIAAVLVPDWAELIPKLLGD